jgi:hypothetical protein
VLVGIAVGHAVGTAVGSTVGMVVGIAAWCCLGILDLDPRRVFPLAVAGT